MQKLTEHERRELTIARLPNLRRLNGGGDISAKEREEAERNFIRRFHDYEVKPARSFSWLKVNFFLWPSSFIRLGTMSCVMYTAVWPHLPKWRLDHDR